MAKKERPGFFSPGHGLGLPAKDEISYLKRIMPAAGLAGLLVGTGAAPAALLPAAYIGVKGFGQLGRGYERRREENRGPASAMIGSYGRFSIPLAVPVTLAGRLGISAGQRLMESSKAQAGIRRLVEAIRKIKGK